MAIEKSATKTHQELGIIHRGVRVIVSHEDGELDRQLLVAMGHVAHVLVLHDVLVVDQDAWVARVPIAAVVMHVQFFVVEAVVGARAAPRRERADRRFGPRVVRVVHCQRRHARAIQIVRVECVSVQLQLRLLR